MLAMSPARIAAVVYIAYFVVGVASGALAHGDIAKLARGQSSAAATAAWLASTVIYALLVVLLARLVWSVDPRVAVTAAAFGLLGCAVQFAATLLRTGRGGPVAALFLFGVFMALYGWLLARSSVAPLLIGLMFMVAGLGWSSGPIPGLPTQFRLGAQGFGALAEGVLAVWLLVAG